MATRAITLKRGRPYTPLRYPGGKTALAGFLGERITDLGLADGTYCEPFAGGAGAALTLLMLERVQKIIVNDLDPAIYAFWWSVTQRTDAFLSLLEDTPVTVDEWHRQRDVYLAADGRRKLALGYATFFLNRVNRSGIVEGWPIGGLDQSGKWKIDARFNRAGLSSRIEKIGLYRDRIQVLNEDAIDLLAKVLPAKECFTYLDPPYFCKGRSLYLNHFQQEDHRDLAAVLSSNLDANWLLTYDNVPAIRKLFKSHKSTNFSIGYSAYERRLGSETMIFSKPVWHCWAQSRS